MSSVGVLDLDASLKERTLPGVKGNYLEVDVPPDGNCLFYSIVMAALFPLAKNREKFFEVFRTMFGEQGALAEDIWNKLKCFNGNVHIFEKGEGFLALKNLINNVFRQRVVKYMRDNNLVDPNSIPEYEGNVNRYLEGMAQPGAWGGDQELAAMSALLNVHITVHRLVGENELQNQGQEYGAKFNTHVNLLFVVAEYEKEEVEDKYHDHNHYRFLIKPEVFDPRLALVPSNASRLESKGEENKDSQPRPSHSGPKHPSPNEQAFQRELDTLKREVDQLTRADEKELGMTLWRTLSSQKSQVLNKDPQTSIPAAIYCQQQVLNTKQRMAEINRPSIDNVLTNIALFFAGLGFGYLIAACVHYKQTGRFGFFNKPALAAQLPKVSQTLQACAREVSPALSENKECPEALADFKQWTPYRI